MALSKFERIHYTNLFILSASVYVSLLRCYVVSIFSNLQLTLQIKYTCSYSTTETLEKSVKYVQS